MLRKQKKKKADTGVYIQVVDFATGTEDEELVVQQIKSFLCLEDITKLICQLFALVKMYMLSRDART